MLIFALFDISIVDSVIVWYLGRAMEFLCYGSDVFDISFVIKELHSILRFVSSSFLLIMHEFTTEQKCKYLLLFTISTY